MPAGKLASQAGHAFLQAFQHCERIHPETASRYAADPPGTKVVLCARDLDALLWAAERAAHAGLPHALITDRGHVLPPHFDGSAIVTALGIGPVTRREVRAITKAFALVR